MELELQQPLVVLLLSLAELVVRLALAARSLSQVEQVVPVQELVEQLRYLLALRRQEILPVELPRSEAVQATAQALVEQPRLLVVHQDLARQVMVVP